MDISVIVPVYNGEKTLTELTGRITRTLEGKFTFEQLLIHDHGKDDSREVINNLEKENPEIIKGFILSRNLGQHNAILRGIKEASGNFIVTLDEDLQHDPSYIPLMLAKMKEGDYDVVYARFKKLKHPGTRIRLSEMLRVLLKNLIPGLYPGYSPYRLIRRATAQKILSINYRYTFIDGYLGMVTKRFGSVEAEHYRRADGRSSYSFYKLFRHAFLIAIHYSRIFNRSSELVLKLPEEDKN